MELLLNNPSHLVSERKEALLKLVYSTHFRGSIFIDKGDFSLFFHDIWSLFEIGDDYKSEIIEGDVRLKEWRIFILDFFASRNMEKMQYEYLSNSSVKKFMISLYIVKKIADKYFTSLIKTLKIEEIKSEYPINLKNKLDRALQREILLRIQNNWYVNLYKFNKVYDMIVDEVLDEVNAVEQLFGEVVWETVSNHNLEKLFCYLKAQHFTEVLFWKSKFQTDQFLKVGLDSNSTYVFCVQKDITMRRSLNLQTALALAVSEFSQQNDHNFVFLPFAHTLEQEMIAHNGNIDFDHYVGFNKFYGCKTEPIDFKSAINYAFTMLKLGLSHSNSGKIYMLCNELLFQDLPTEEEWRMAVNHYKKLKEIEIVVIYIGDKSKLQPIWFADKVMFPQQLAQFA